MVCIGDPAIEDTVVVITLILRLPVTFTTIRHRRYFETYTLHELVNYEIYKNYQNI